MKKYIIIILVSVCISLSTGVGSTLAQLSNFSVLTGKIVDIDGKPLPNAEIFIYNTQNIRRPADYISRATRDDGNYKITIPPGTYWVVARVRKGERYGPLNPGDKHSGDPLEIEIAANETIEEDFAVVNLKESAKLVRKVKKDYFKIQGTLLFPENKPIPNAYAFARKTKGNLGIPDYLSAWTGSDGRFELYLPAGEYFFGYSTRFPPDNTTGSLIQKEINANEEGFVIITGPIRK